MKTIAVIGTGPVGLATADILSLNSNETRVILCSPPEKEVPETYQAAAAFWTPFSSGVGIDRELDLSQKTLEFYERFRKDERQSGVLWRPIEQHWLSPHLVMPAWENLPPLNFERCGKGVRKRSFDNLKVRKEFCYETPVINVPIFRKWYIDHLSERLNVDLETIRPIRFGFQGTELEEITPLIRKYEISSVVLCLGASTVYQNLFNPATLTPANITFRKGVVIRLDATPRDDEPVILFEGGMFDSQALYVVPHRDCYIVGGTISVASDAYTETDWKVNDEELAGILDRAETFLPKRCLNKLAKVGLLEATKSDCRVGVRPMLNGKGPHTESNLHLSQLFSDAVHSPITVYSHFGHGGSGFTFCHDTARICEERLRNDGVLC